VKRPTAPDRHQALAALLLVCVGLVVAGVAQWSRPAAYVVAGLLLAAWSFAVVLEVKPK
jgi:hypothetical protein